MSSLTIDLDDATARLIESAAQVAKQPVRDWVRDSICYAAEQIIKDAAPASASVRRVFPLHPGAMKASSDFNAPLDEFAPYV
jgi:uncharacterized protein (DUF1778 family)